MKNLSYLFLLLFLGINTIVQAQRAGCDNNAGGEITVGASCSFTPWDSNNNGDWWDNASGCGGWDGDDVWAWFTATSTSTTITYSPDAGFDAVMHLFEGGCATAGTLTAVDCADNVGSGSDETITFATTIGTVYHIRIQDYWDNASYGGDLCVYNAGGGGGGPANDLCANATNLPCGTTLIGETTVGTSNTAHGTACFLSNYGVWYTFVGDGQQTTIDVNNSYDIELSISTGSCGAFSSSIVCTDFPEDYTFTTVNGVTYYVYVAYWTTGSTTGTFDILRTCSPAPVAPANDLCANATNLPCGTTLIGETTVNSTNTAHGTACSLSNYGVWYTFVGDGQITTVDINNSYDIELSISTGSCGAFSSSIVCTDFPEDYTFTTVNGVTYYIYVAYWTTGSTTGTFDILRTCTVPPPPPPNDDCANATVLTMSTDGTCDSEISTVYGATNSLISSCGGTANDDVWFSFVATNDSAYIIRDADFDSEVEAFDGCGGTSLGCQDSEGSFELTGLTVGNTYIIRVHSYSSTVPSQANAGFNICVIGPEPPTNTSCASMAPICSDTPIAFLAASGGSEADIIDPTNNYGCLTNSPNPTWFYMEIDTAGVVAIDITANSDVDFALWGPYSNLTNAQAACGSLPAPIDCSYSTSATEQANTNAIAGDVYVLLVTNYADVSQSINLNSAGSNTASTNCAIVLPITLTSFNGNNIGNKNILNWTTSSEINNDYFSIEDSKNSIDFNEIGRVIGAGNSNQLLTYKFEDEQPLADVTYYRLKQVDFDGQFEYSKIIAIKTAKDFTVNIYPNPSKKDLYFDISSTKEETVTIIYTDIIGNTFKEFVQIAKGANTYQANEFNNLSKGIYFVRIMSENNDIIKQEKVIKQ